MIEGEQLGGAELSLVNLLAMPQTSAFEFVLVGANRPVVHELGRRIGIETLTTASPDPPGPGSYRVLLEQARPDLVQVTLPNPAACVSHQLAAHSLGLPVIAVEQLVRGITRRQRLAKTATSRLLVDHVAVGGASARRLERFALLPPGSVRTIYNGIPDDRLAVDAKRTPGRSIVTVARLEHQKGIAYLLEAMPRIEGAKLTLIGDGALRSQLEAKAVDLKVADRLQFSGWVDDPRPLLANHDLFVLPSVDEAFPLTVVEAMLAGVAVVATDVGSVAEAVVDNETGRLVPPRRPDLLADVVAAALDAPQDRRRWARQAGERARKRFTAAVMADAYVNMWRHPRGRLPLRGQLEAIGSLTP